MKNKLIELKACQAAREWAADKTIEEIWATCHRGDWMLWLARKLNIDKRPLTLAKGLCANTVRHLMKDERSINAVDMAIKYGNGEASEGELAAAYAAAYAAADAAAAAADDAADAYAAAADAADAAAAAAYAAYAAYADDADAAADAAAAYAAYAADADAARTKSQLATAQIVRETITIDMIKLKL